MYICAYTKPVCLRRRKCWAGRRLSPCAMTNRIPLPRTRAHDSRLLAQQTTAPPTGRILEFSVPAQIQGVLACTPGKIALFSRATSEPGRTKPWNFGTWNRVSRARSKTPKFTAARDRPSVSKTVFRIFARTNPTPSPRSPAPVFSVTPSRIARLTTSVRDPFERIRTYDNEPPFRYTAEMGILIGMDEAGYGPNLGPLVVAATAWEVDEEQNARESPPRTEGERFRFGLRIADHDTGTQSAIRNQSAIADTLRLISTAACEPSSRAPPATAKSPSPIRRRFTNPASACVNSNSASTASCSPWSNRSPAGPSSSTAAAPIPTAIITESAGPPDSIAGSRSTPRPTNFSPRPAAPARL